MNFTLYVWRQDSREAEGKLTRYEAKNIREEASVLEMLDIEKEDLTERG